jgi:competence protein ComEC
VQVAVTIGLLPVVLSIFGNLSLVSPLANAMAIPLFTALIVPLVLLGALTCWIYVPLGEWLLRSAAYVLDLSWPALEWLARQPSAVWYFPHVPLVPFAALVIGVLLLLLPGIWPTRITGLLLCLPAMIYRPEAPAFGAFALQLLDVGQGLAVVIQTQHHALLYDTGPAFRTGRDTGELVILPYLRWRGIRALDTLMVSHGDLDHAGGMRSVLAAMPVHTVKVGPSVHPAPPGASHCRSGQRWTWDGVQFEVLYPPGAGPGDSHDAKRSDNDTSCVLRISTQAGSALLSGDIEALSEARLVREGLPPTDVVVVPHHGSRSSSSVAFVGAVDARLALFSCGYRNRWGFPKPDVQLRWQYQGAQTASTIDSGAISVLVGMGEPLQITEHRHAHPRYWQRTAPARDEVHNQAAP